MTDFGLLPCYVITGNAVNQIGETSLTAYFNQNYGFILLKYTNIDRSIITLKRIKN